MPLTIRYDERDKPAGYRVTRTSQGENRQAYFPLDDYQSADELNTQLAAWKETNDKRAEKITAVEAKPRNYKADAYAAPRQTGIVGLQIEISANRPGTRYDVPCIVIQSRDSETEKRVRTRRVISSTTRTLYQAWRESCQLLATLKGLDDVPYHWYRAEPKPEQFVALRDFMIESGKDVPKGTLDAVFRE